MRQIICEEKECYLEPAKVSQVGGGANELTYMMAGEQDGLSPTEPTYMVPLRQTSGGQSTRKLRRKRKSVIQVGGGRKKKSSSSGGSKKKKTAKRIGGSRGWRSKQLSGGSKHKRKVQKKRS